MKKLVVLAGLLFLVSLASAGGLTVSMSDTTGAPEDTVKVPINLEGASAIGSIDVNEDGKISSLDARKILRVAAGLEVL